MFTAESYYAKVAEAKKAHKESQELVGQTLYCTKGLEQDGSLNIKEYAIKEVRLMKSDERYALALALYNATTGETSDAEASWWYELLQMQELVNGGVIWHYEHFLQGTAYEEECQSTNLYRLKNYILNNNIMNDNNQEQQTTADAASMPRHEGAYNITPELATEWLKGNTNNRNISKTKLALYIDQIRKGEWRSNPIERIGFTKEGRLIDGQHRLMAVIKAGIPTEMYVTWEAKEDDFKVINTGKNRSKGDVFAIAGIDSAKSMATVTQGVMQLMDGMMAIGVSHKEKRSFASSYTGNAVKYTHSMLLAFCEEHQEILRQAYLYGRRLHRNNATIMSGNEIAIYIAYLQIGKGHPCEKVTKFFDSLCTADRGYPYLCNLHVKLNKWQTGELRIPGTVRQNLIAKAWNMYLANSQATKIPKLKDGQKIDFD